MAESGLLEHEIRDDRLVGADGEVGRLRVLLVEFRIPLALEIGGVHLRSPKILFSINYKPIKVPFLIKNRKFPN